MRFHIPSFKPLLDEIKEYVKEKQGNKDSVCLDYEDKDKCYAMLWGYEGASEEIITDIKVGCDTLYFKIGGEWYNIFEGGIYSYQTLLNIAYTIEDILEEE